MDAILERQRVDLIVLDLMMPGEDGLSVCRRLAATRRIPVVMLSAASEETDRIVGLEVGADDYVRKPCSPRELLARIRAVLRRAADRGEGTDASGDRDLYDFADWRLDMMRRELRSPDGVLVNLSSGEFALLRAFLEHPQRVLTRDQLLDYARGRDAFAYDRAIDVQVSRLRRKLESASNEAELIKTVRNDGLRLRRASETAVNLRKIATASVGSIAQQVMLLLLAALVIANFVSIAIIAAQPPPQRQVADFGQGIERFRAILPQIQGGPGSGRRAALAKVSDRALQFTIARDLPPRSDDELTLVAEHRVASQLGIPQDQVRALVRTRNGLIRQLLKETAPNDQIINALGFVGPTQVAVKLKTGEWVTATMARQTEQEAWLRTTFLSFIGATLLLTPLGLLFARRLASPIGEFAEAADQLGRNPDAPLLEEKGPRELRSAVQAFNTMQERLRRFVEGRTLMMAAISHDLRTPLQRLRFRIDSLDDDARNAMLADIEEMEAMIGSALAFASDEAAPGARQTLDLGALVSSVCDEAADAGGAAQCAVAERVVGQRRSGAAQACAQQPCLQRDEICRRRRGARRPRARRGGGGGGRSRAGDPGRPPGGDVSAVPAAGALAQPADRRRRGWGLSIARTIARAHGGDVTLSPRPGGGLTARMALPA